MTPIGDPLRCGSYHLGHETHWIQAKLAIREPSRGTGTARVEADGWITVDLNSGQSVRRWTHDPARLAQQLAAASHRIELRAKGVLGVPSAQGLYIISVAEEPSPCPNADEVTGNLSPVELLQQRGGFTARLEARGAGLISPD